VFTTRRRAGGARNLTGASGPSKREGRAVSVGLAGGDQSGFGRQRGNEGSRNFSRLMVMAVCCMVFAGLGFATSGPMEGRHE